MIKVLNDTRLCALFLGLLAGASLLAAWTFEYGFGLIPCPLCLWQRVAPSLAFVVLVGGFFADRLWPAGAHARRALWVGVVLFAANAMLGVFHAGVEWAWWEGLSSCGGAGVPDDFAAFMEDGGRLTPVSCSDAAWRFLGLSLAGWNALFSAALAAVSLWAAAYGSSSASQ
jgi:disulfide bond formation protein DsbB